MKELIKKVKEKKEFKELPDSLIEKSLQLSKQDIKKSRAILHKYLGVFLTNKIMKPKDVSDWRVILMTHKSSQKRDYEKIYSEIFEQKNFNSVIDLGCGVNGFSIFEIKRFLPKAEYTGIEATGQIVNLTNLFFEKFNLNKSKVIHLDLFKTQEIKKIIKQSKKPRAIFMFQILDALEAMEKNYTKKLTAEISKELNKEDIFILSYSTKSLSRRKKFYSERKWLFDFLQENFDIKKKFEISDEVFIVFHLKI